MYLPTPPRLGRTSIVVVALAIISLLPVAAPGQTDQGRIVGTVMDANGGIVPGATVLAKNDRTGEERTASTNESGYYILAALKPSTYTVTATAQNLTVRVTSVQLLVGQELNLALTLQATGVEAKVDIAAGADTAIDTGSAAMGVNVNPREVAALPLNGRQLSQLYLQAPGSLNSGSGTYGDIRFNGRAVEQNIIRYDGVEGTAVIDASPGNLNGEVPSPFRLQSSLENVQEFRVESSNYPAEFGTGTGGQISVVTKSGGNKFHGAVFEYLRNDALDAPNFFDNIIGQKAPLRLNQFGGSLGGPLVKEKAFFFVSYEGYRLRAGINSTEAVPGATSRICGPPIGTGTTTCNANTLLLLPAFRDPKAVIVSTGSGINLFDVAQLQSNSVVNENAYALRMDYRFSPKHSAYFRYFRDHGFNDQPEGVTGRRAVFTANPQNGVVAFQSILKPTILNEFKFGYNGVFTRTNGQAPTVNGIDLSRLVINISGNTANFAIPGQGTSAGTATPGGLIRANSATNGRGQPYTVYSLSFLDNLSWSKGNHNMKFGVEFRPSRIYTDRLGGTTYVFNSLAALLTNSPASIQYLGDVSAPSPFNGGATGNRKAEQEYYIGYAQDEWKLRPNLTLNYGLRYEYYTPLREARDLDILFDITNGTLRPPDQPFFKVKHNFGPRVGLTWSPNSSGFFGGGRTVLRGGFGVFYGPGQTEDQIQPIESDRISSTLSSGPLLTFNPDQTAAINAIISNFVNNPNNRAFQPRAYSPEYIVPEKIYSFTASIQQELPYKIVGAVAYVGSRGRNLFLRGLSNTLRAGNAVIVDSTAIPTNAGVVSRTNAAGQVIGVTNVRQFSIVNGTSVQNPFAEIDTKTSGGSDSYNALQLTLARRIGSGLTLNSQYSFSKSFGNTSGSNEARTAAQPFGGAARPSGDTNDYEADRGYNNFDVRHTFNLSAVYDLPIGSKKRYDLGTVGNAILGGWEIGTIMNTRSGLPIDVTITRPDTVAVCSAASCVVNTSATATTTVQNGFTVQLPSISGSQPLPAGFTAVVNGPGGGSSRQTRRPNLISGVNPYLDADRNFLNPAAFAIPAAGTFGNLPRNALKGPNFRQFDLILNRRFRFSESRSIEFRTEVFNLFNHANFANPASTLNVALPTLTFNTTANAFVLGSGLQPGQSFTQSAAGPTFGLLRQTVERTVGLGTNRQIQFALRFNF
ncbi:MAG TPA: TonB-dependent receptor [Pyrinomonadaceae bacterium]|nr:TonB-dependent receptor [Pyrinomonadaceae bacterium]